MYWEPKTELNSRGIYHPCEEIYHSRPDLHMISIEAHINMEQPAALFNFL